MKMKTMECLKTISVFNVRVFSCVSLNHCHSLKKKNFIFSQVFKSEMDDSMKRAYKDKIDSDNLLMEISCSRLAYNISIGDVNELVMEAILSFPNCLFKVNFVFAFLYV